MKIKSQTVADSTILGERTCTATYAMERGLTVRSPMSVATFERVAALFFLDRFDGGGFSMSSSTDDGDVNSNLKAYMQ
jgi:hypothetical protein